MQQSYDEICERIGIPIDAAGKGQKLRRRDYREYYDQQLIDGVAKLYPATSNYSGTSFELD